MTIWKPHKDLTDSISLVFQNVSALHDRPDVRLATLPQNYLEWKMSLLCGSKHPIWAGSSVA
jgi:hypothetical protein